MSSNLLSYANDVYSQAGQDGIIEHIFDVLEIKKGHFVEFGAWDGIYLSNCRKLFEEGWSGVFIESDKDKFLELQKNYESSKQIVCINRKVEIRGADRFDEIMSRYAQDKPITFLSIDVDGCDLEIFESIEKYLPLVACIEGGKGAHPLDPRMPTYCIKNIGQSLNVIKNVAERKGYKILCSFQDVFLIKKHLFQYFNPPLNLFQLYIDGYKARDYSHIPRFVGRLKEFHRKNRILDYVLKETNFYDKYKIPEEEQFDLQRCREWGRENEQQISNILTSLPHFLYNAQIRNHEKIQICLINLFPLFMKKLEERFPVRRLLRFIKNKIIR